MLLDLSVLAMLVTISLFFSIECPNKIFGLGCPNFENLTILPFFKLMILESFTIAFLVAKSLARLFSSSTDLLVEAMIKELLSRFFRVKSAQSDMTLSLIFIMSFSMCRPCSSLN